MLNKLFKTLFLLVITSSTLIAKNNVLITGKVIEKENGKALSFATISIHSTGNTVVGGTTSGNDGSFRLQNSLEGDFKIKVSFIGFKDTVLNLVVKNENSIDLGIIALSNDVIALKSAVVTSKVPVIEQKLDKIVMNVAEAVSTQGSNALDILKKAPGVSVDPSGNILLNGSKVQVWIDGRPSNLNGADLESLLNGTDGSTIDKIEIIAHPSSRYDAEGSGGIINIKTRRNFAKGLNGSARSSYTSAPYKTYYHGADASLVLNHRGEKNNTSLAISPRYNEGFNSFKTKTYLGEENIVASNTLLDRTQTYNSFKLSNDYYANKKNIFGFVVTGMLRNFIDSSDNNTGSQFYTNNIVTQDVFTKIRNNSNFNNISANANYTRIFKDNQELTVNADYFYYDLGSKNNQLNVYKEPWGDIKKQNHFKTSSSQFINIKSFKADYEHLIKNKIKLESGVKWAQSTTDNTLVRLDNIENIWVKNQSQSTEFFYTEDISAAYLSLGGQIGKKITLKGGLRAEYTNSKGEWITADTTTTKSYLDLFPTFYFGYNPNKDLRWGLSYTLRVQRPNFENLNPQRFYIDATSSALGNPDLNPQYGHQMSLTLGVKRHFNFGFNSQFFNNVIVQTPSFEEETGDKLLTWDNFGKMNMVGINAAITEFPVIKWFILNANLSVANVNSSNNDYRKSSIFTNGNFNATFLLPEDTKIEFTGWYQSGIPYGFFNIRSNSDFSLGIKKGVLKSQGTISLFAGDIFGTNISRVNLSNNVFDKYEFESKYRSRRITLTFNYRFGQSKAVKQRKVGNMDEASRVSTGN